MNVDLDCLLSERQERELRKLIAERQNNAFSGSWDFPEHVRLHDGTLVHRRDIIRYLLKWIGRA